MSSPRSPSSRIVTPRLVRSAAAVPHRLGFHDARTLEKDSTTPDGQPRDTRYEN
jgi:hypothetical protein